MPKAQRHLHKAISNRINCLKNLTERWYKEYLLQLRSANVTCGSHSEPISVGDVCLLHDDRSRIEQELVRIVSAHPGVDYELRTFTVCTKNGNPTPRSAQLLYPLDVTDAQNATSNEG